MSAYYPPRIDSKAFNCPHCAAYAQQHWATLLFPNNSHSIVKVSRCTHCQQAAYWVDGVIVRPITASVPLPHPDLPTECLADYNEARDVFSVSPRASAALLRLVVQKLMVALGKDGKNINSDIGALVKDGMPHKVQQAMDFCRVVGNNAVHPLEMSIEQEPEIAAALFDMVNFIVEDRITRHRQINELYSRLPEGAMKAIEKRDGVQASVALTPASGRDA